MPRIGVVIPAGGLGRRLRTKTPKQFMMVGGTTILERSITAFTTIGQVDEVVVVVPARHLKRVVRFIGAKQIPKIGAIVAGGEERQHSVWNGLKAFSRPPDIVLVHDAARPLITRRIIEAVIRETRRYDAAVVGVKISDTVKLEKNRGFYATTLDRSKLWTVQTPQGFLFELLVRAHENARRKQIFGTDEAFLVERLRKPIRIVEGEPTNIKITTKGDLKRAEFLLKML